MADALISPVVGGVMTAASAGLLGYSVRKVSADEGKAPLMGVMGAFVFAAQMINFAIPGTGSSGHLGGGLLLAALLGPAGGFLTLACVLVIQAFFFADGGLLALGCNIFNMGFFTCFFAYPLIYSRVTAKNGSARRIWIGSVAASVAGLQLGAFAVVVQTTLSGKTELPFQAFALIMQPIHLAIGVAEGLITAAALTFVRSVRPGLLKADAPPGTKPAVLLAVLLAAAMVLGGAASLISSSKPDGLEYAIETLDAQPQGDSSLHEALRETQERTALMPDYSADTGGGGGNLAGIIGGVLTLGLTGLVAFVCFLVRRKRKAMPS